MAAERTGGGAHYIVFFGVFDKTWLCFLAGLLNLPVDDINWSYSLVHPKQH